MAHNVDTFFDEFTRKIHNTTLDGLTVQVHGCGSTFCPSTGGDGDVGARVSAGSIKALPTESTANAYASALFDRIALTGAAVRRCNLNGQPDYELCAATNVQGRYVNGETQSPCTSNVDAGSNGRFLHIEANLNLRTTQVADLVGALDDIL